MRKPSKHEALWRARRSSTDEPVAPPSDLAPPESVEVDLDAAIEVTEAEPVSVPQPAKIREGYRDDVGWHPSPAAKSYAKHTLDCKACAAENESLTKGA